jgi:hypothetical protein
MKRHEKEEAPQEGRIPGPPLRLWRPVPAASENAGSRHLSKTFTLHILGGKVIHGFGGVIPAVAGGVSRLAGRSGSGKSSVLNASTGPTCPRRATCGLPPTATDGSIWPVGANRPCCGSKPCRWDTFQVSRVVRGSPRGRRRRALLNPGKDAGEAGAAPRFCWSGWPSRRVSTTPIRPRSAGESRADQHRQGRDLGAEAASARRAHGVAGPAFRTVVIEL